MSPWPTLFEHGYALLIGAGNYPHISHLPSSMNDASAIYQILTNPERGGYLKEQVKPLIDKKASKQAILDGLDWLAECADNDPEATIIFYFSGHGGTMQKKYLLLPNDFTWDMPDESGITADKLLKKLSKITARRQLIVLDTCYANGIGNLVSREYAFYPNQQEDLQNNMNNLKGRAIVAACRADQYAQVHFPARHSIFSEALLEALDCYAADSNGNATLLRTLAYVSDQVKNITDGEQVPVINMQQMEDFPICRINTNLAAESPFKRSRAYEAAPLLQKPGNNITMTNLQTFKQELRTLLDEQGYAVVHTVLEKIEQSGFFYDKPTFANLRSDAMSVLASLTANNFIVRLKVFIGTLREAK